MPVILARDDEATWLDPAIEDVGNLQPLLRSYWADSMEMQQVNPALNKPSFEGPECLSPPSKNSAV
jgi:putative SOS response-associated peptidase YedK